MDKVYSNLIYLDKERVRFSFYVILIFLLFPYVVITTLAVLTFGLQGIRQPYILLSLGGYTIFTTALISISYFFFENNREKSIRILDEGLVYNSLSTKFAIPWDGVIRVKINPYASLKETVLVETTKGRFIFTGMFVNTNDELPKIKPGLIKPKFYYPSGGRFTDKDILKNELFMDLRSKVPDKFY